MESALWVVQGRERFRFCSCCVSLCLSKELAEQWVVQLVAASSCADQHASLNEARAMLSVYFPGEVMRRNIAFGDRKSNTSELQSLTNLVCRLLLEKKKKKIQNTKITKTITQTRHIHTHKT